MNTQSAPQRLSRPWLFSIIFIQTTDRPTSSTLLFTVLLFKCARIPEPKTAIDLYNRVAMSQAGKYILASQREDGSWCRSS